MKTYIVHSEYKLPTVKYPCVKKYIGSTCSKGELIVLFTGPEEGVCLVDFDKNNTDRTGTFRRDWVEASSSDWADWSGSINFKN
jgi:hypothetical protein